MEIENIKVISTSYATSKSSIRGILFRANQIGFLFDKTVTDSIHVLWK